MPKRKRPGSLGIDFREGARRPLALGELQKSGRWRRAFQSCKLMPSINFTVPRGERWPREWLLCEDQCRMTQGVLNSAALAALRSPI